MATKSLQIFNKLTRLKNLHSISYYRYYTRINKEYTKQAVAITSPAPDYLIQNLKNAENLKNVFEIVGDHYKIMNTKQSMQALRSIFFLQKQGSSNLSTNEIIQNPNFEKLCHHLKTQAGLIEVNDTIEALKILSYVGISSKSSIVQVLLQLVRHNINDLSLHHIIFLDFLLRQFKSSPLIDALLIATPIVFDANIRMKMDRRNVIHLVEYLQYVSKKRVSEQCITLIVNNLCAHFDNAGLMEPKLAKSVLWSICDMEENEFFEPLFEHALNAFLTNINSVEWRDFETTASKLVTKFSLRYQFYYNQVFFDTYSNYVIDKDLGFHNALHTLRKLRRMNHTNDNLLNYLSEKCFENPRLLTEASAMNMFTIAMVVALTEFRPVYWKIIENALISTTCFTDDNKSDILWMKLGATLCSVGIYKNDVLAKCFDTSYLESIIKQKNSIDCDNFILICQAISAFQPNYLHLLPPKSVIDMIVSYIKFNEDYPLETPLMKGLGGENYILTGIKSDIGHHIDHIVLLRKGGYPVSLPQNINYLEAINVPSDSQLILILVLGPSHYTINSKRLKSTTALMLRTLECKSHTVIPISFETWESLADFEKVPYLMQEIKSRSETEQISDIR